MSDELPSVSIKLDVPISFDARSVVLHDAMNALFEVDVLAVSSAHDVDFDPIVGEPARVDLVVRGSRRTIAGVVAEAELISFEPSGLSTYRFRVVPPMWLLTQRSNWRIEQYRSEVESVLLLLRGWDIHPVVELDLEQYARRKYRVQYGETDFRWASRLLEEAGVSYWVREREGKSWLVLGDAAERGPRRDLTYVTDLVPQVPGATELRSLSTLSPGRFVVRDSDLRLAPEYPLYAAAAAGVELESVLEVYEVSPGFMHYVLPAGGDTPSADDRGVARTDEKRGARLAEVRAAQLRAFRDAVRFETNTLDVRVGDVVRIVGYLGDDVAPRSDSAIELLVTSLDLVLGHEGHLSLSCVGVPAGRSFRPPRKTPKPIATGIESATVVGRKGAEIDTDEFARVRVAFHWDRESAHDDTSSCWLPVSQPWAGAGYGAVNLPRVGQEVLVDFENGDPDRPIVVGRTYTATVPVPYALPKSSTESGWRSNSTNQKGGYNEIRLQDSGTKELFSLQAEKNMEIAVGHEMNELVTGSRHVWTDKVDVEATNLGRATFVTKRRDEQIGETDLTGCTVNMDTECASFYGTGKDAFGVKAKKLTIKGTVVTFESESILSVETEAGKLVMFGAGAAPPPSVAADEGQLAGFQQVMDQSGGQGFIVFDGGIIDINPGAPPYGDAPVTEEQAQEDRDFEAQQNDELGRMSDQELDAELKKSDGEFGKVPMNEVPWWDDAWDKAVWGSDDVKDARRQIREERVKQVVARRIAQRESTLGRPVAPQVKNRYPNPRTSGRTTSR